MSRKPVRRHDAEQAVEDMQARAFVTISSRHLVPKALNIAFKFNQGVYDCLYAAPAVEAKADRITADERLAHALAASFPIKWLGAF